MLPAARSDLRRASYNKLRPQRASSSRTDCDRAERRSALPDSKKSIDDHGTEHHKQHTGLIEPQTQRLHYAGQADIIAQKRLRKQKSPA